MRVRRLWLTDFRSYASLELELAAGLTAVMGPNGLGKTNLLEAIAYLATLESFRGAPLEALVRQGCLRAAVRAEVDQQARRALVEAEIVPGGRGRVLVNRQRLTRTRDLLGVLRVTVFAPDDLELVKGGPAQRRRYLDDGLVARQPRLDAVRLELDRVLRQRNALLRQVAGVRADRLPADVAVTLDVWDAKLTTAGEALGAARAELVERLQPRLRQAYDDIAAGPVPVDARYEPAWRPGGLAAALAAARAEELRRGVTLVGPHRDDLELVLAGLPARTHASQGEQRTLALALRLALHRILTDELASPPVLLLDDVFSELDTDRADALVRHLPEGQAVLTTASGLPARVAPDQVVRLPLVAA
ncbi:MAG: DNA replication/repair protein RecF [Acidimicrobiales bacterium]|nr:DNA replication/repair protein RecF [Acidimicrobiales bacterium]